MGLALNIIVSSQGEEIKPINSLWHQPFWSALDQVMVSCLFGTNVTITWSNAGLLLIRQLETNLSEIVIKIQAFLFKEMYLQKLVHFVWASMRGNCLHI